VTLDRTPDRLSVSAVRKLTPELMLAELREFEARYEMTSSDFYARYQARELSESTDFVEWAGRCHTALRRGVLTPADRA